LRRRKLNKKRKGKIEKRISERGDHMMKVRIKKVDLRNK
jgi:uncharacterized protein (DUF2249 family)